MKSITLGQSDLLVPVIGLGCVKLADISVQDATLLVQTALDLGINFFDHADIYTRGESEIRFGEVLKANTFKREDLIIQTKTGNPRGWYDFSSDYIFAPVENTLKTAPAASVNRRADSPAAGSPSPRCTPA